MFLQRKKTYIHTHNLYSVVESANVFHVIQNVLILVLLHNFML